MDEKQGGGVSVWAILNKGSFWEKTAPDLFFLSLYSWPSFDTQ